MFLGRKIEKMKSTEDSVWKTSGIDEDDESTRHAIHSSQTLSSDIKVRMNNPDPLFFKPADISALSRESTDVRADRILAPGKNRFKTVLSTAKHESQ